MVDELRNRSDRILKNIISGIAGSADAEATARDLLFGFLSKAGKSKDEVIQVLGREIGLALAAMLAKPIEHLTETKRVRITVELVPKEKKRSSPSDLKRKTSRSRSSKSSSRTD